MGNAFPTIQQITIYQFESEGKIIENTNYKQIVFERNNRIERGENVSQISAYTINNRLGIS